MPDDPQLELTPAPTPDPSPAPAAPAADPAAERIRSLEEQIAALTNEVRLSRQQPPAPAPVAAPREEYSEDQLLELANAGNKEALKLYTERVSSRHAQSTAAQRQAAEDFQREYADTFKAHPELKDASHPVTKLALEIQADLLAKGWPRNAVTELEAVKRAFLRAPVPVAAPAREEPVPPGRTVEPSVTRRPTAPVTPQPRKPSPRSLEIAARMGVKEPAKALERFDERQSKGRSSLSPTLALLMRESQ